MLRTVCNFRFPFSDGNLGTRLTGLFSITIPLSSFILLWAGYVGAKSFLDQVYALVLELKQNNRDITYG